jgi:hypothetical protein
MEVLSRKGLKVFFLTCILGMCVWLFCACSTKDSKESRKSTASTNTEVVVIESILGQDMVYARDAEQTNIKYILSFSDDAAESLNKGDKLEIQYEILEKTNPIHLKVLSYTID